MTYLVDTHILLWSFTNPEKLPEKIKTILLNEENTILYSQISLWEISLKYSLGKLELKKSTPESFYEELDLSFYQCKPILNEELITFHKLPKEHKDPFDRMLIWQCIVNKLIFITVDREIQKYKKYGLLIEEF
jgi:PIN domain nuclease of toxin-antitoxin system